MTMYEASDVTGNGHVRQVIAIAHDDSWNAASMLVTNDATLNVIANDVTQNAISNDAT